MDEDHRSFPLEPSDPPEDTSTDLIPVARPVALPLAWPTQKQGDAFLLLTSSRASAWADIGLVLPLVVALVLGIELLLYFWGLAHGKSLQPADLEALAHSHLIPILTLRAAGVVVLIAAMLRWRRQSWRAVGLAWSPMLLHCVLGVVAMGVCYALTLLWVFLTKWFWPELWDQMTENTQRLIALFPPLKPLEYGAVALMVGVYEELFFRGFLMLRLRRATGSWILALLVSTTFFTALHALDQTNAALVSITILSVVFSVVTIWRRSIVPAIVGHFLFDLMQFIGLYAIKGAA